VRRGKDSLALGRRERRHGLQARSPVALGMVATPWALDAYAVVAGCIGVAGGALAVWRHGAASVAWAALLVAFVAAPA
jgi:hypothetical protein